MKVFGIFALGFVIAAPAFALQSDAQIKQQIVRQSIASHPGLCA